MAGPAWTVEAVFRKLQKCSPSYILRLGQGSTLGCSHLALECQAKTTLPKHSRHCDHDHCLLLTLNPPPRTRTTNTRPRNNAFPDPHTLWHGIVAPRNCEKAKLLPVSALLQLDSVALGPTGSDKWKLTSLAAAATCTIVTVAI